MTDAERASVLWKEIEKRTTSRTKGVAIAVRRMLRKSFREVRHADRQRRDAARSAATDNGPLGSHFKLQSGESPTPSMFATVKRVRKRPKAAP